MSYGDDYDDDFDDDGDEGLGDEYEQMRANEAQQAAWRAIESETQHLLLGFGQQMLFELCANAHKGDWRTVSLSDLDGELAKHVAKLERAVELGDVALVREHAADVAVVAFMIQRAAERAAAPVARLLAELGPGPGRD